MYAIFQSCTLLKKYILNEIELIKNKKDIYDIYLMNIIKVFKKST